MNDTYCRVFGLVASQSHNCLLLRRGPSNWVQAILWDTKKDLFHYGDWFKGRIYERRSDISPNGKYFIYFANKINSRTLQDINGYTYAWTAIGEAPNLKAIMLWPKGDCWHGGGLFLDNKNIWLNHSPDVAIPHPEHVSNKFLIESNPHAHGEDWPIYEKKLLRDGWVNIQPGSFSYKDKVVPPSSYDIWQKTAKNKTILQRVLQGISFSGFGSIYKEKYLIKHKRGEFYDLDACWADFTHNNKLIFVRRGIVCKLIIKSQGFDEVKLIDLNTANTAE